MAEKITNLPSDQARMLQGVTQYQQTANVGIEDYQRAIQDKVKQLSQGIVSGMSDTERKILEGQITDLTNRANQARAAMTGAYQFSAEQAQRIAESEQAQLAAAQQQALERAGQTLGAVSQQLAPGAMTAAQRDAMLAAQRQSAANLAFLGGGAAAPAEFMAREQIGTPGIAGTASTAQQLYRAGLEAARASSLAQTSANQLNLETALRNQALQSAAEREQKQRDFIRDFELAGFKSVLDQKFQLDTKIAELRANAATADTRTAQQKFKDDLAKLRAEEAIKLANNLKIIQAQNAAKGTAAPKLTAEQQRVNLEVVGSTSKFANYLDSLLLSKPTTPAKAQFLKGQEKAGRFYVLNGQVMRLYTDPDTKMEVPKAIPLNNIYRILNETAGYALLNNPNRAQLKTTVNTNLALLQQDPDLWYATQYLLGTGDAGKIADLMLSKNPGAAQNPYAGLSYAQLGAAYGDIVKQSLFFPSAGTGTKAPAKTPTPTPKPTPKPTPNPKPTPKK